MSSNIRSEHTSGENANTTEATSSPSEGTSLLAGQGSYPTHCHSKRYATSIGLDTARFVAADFTIGKSAEMKVRNPINAATGEVSNDPLYQQGGDGPVVEGTVATYYDERFQVRIYGPACLVLQANLPKLLRPTNLRPVTSAAQFDRALQELESGLVSAGIRTDVCNSKLTRLDICRNIVTDEELSDYRPALQELSFPRAERKPYDHGGTQWENGARRLKIYDKGEEQSLGEGQSLDAGQLQRVEYSLTSSRSVGRHVGLDAVGDLREDFSAAGESFREAIRTLIPEGQQSSEQKSLSSRSAYAALLDKLEGRGKQNMAAITAMAGAFLREQGGLQPFLDTLREESGRQTCGRYRKKFESVSGAIDLLQESQRAVSDMKSELRTKLLA